MIIYRYLTRQVLVVTLTVTSILALILLGGRFIQYLGKVAEGYLEFSVLFVLIGLRMPVFLQLILPLSLFLGILLVMGRMYADSEMAVLKATGFGQNDLLKMLAQPIIVTATIVAVIALWVAPWSYNKSLWVGVQQSARTAIEQVTPGKFYKSTSGGVERVVFVESLTQDKSHIENVFIAENKTGAVSDNTDMTQAPSTLFSKKGSIKHDNNQRYLVLEDGWRQQGWSGQGDYQVINFQTYETLLPSAKLTINKSYTQGYASEDLFRQIRTDAKLATELYWRLSLVLLTLVMGVVAVPISQVKPRQGRFAKMIPALLLYLLYLGMLISIKSAAEATMNGWAYFAGVHAFFIVLALFLLRPKFKKRRKAAKEEAKA